MELGQHELQIFVTVVIILGAAVVALICDFLKGNNERLRELNIELRIRQEEEQKRARPLTPSTAGQAESLATPISASIDASAPLPAAATHLAAPRERTAANKEKKRAVNAEALAAMERGAALAGSGQRPRPAVAPHQQTPEVIVVAQSTAKTASGGTGKKDWGTLLSRNAQKPAAISHDLLADVVAATNSSATAQAAQRSLPAGFQDGFVLNQLVQNRQPVSGLVVSIGVNSSPNSGEAVSKLIGSLIGPGDFAAQSSDDEFLLIYPQEHGASAQRRLSQIAQQLWDFQLRSLGSFQILFSWGGIEVRSEMIEEAIASASERMQETKRGRKLLTMESPSANQNKDSQLRQAV